MSSFTGTRQVKLIEAKRGDTLPIDLAFALDGAEQKLPPGAVITFAANAPGVYDATPVVLSNEFVATGPLTKATATATLGTGVLVGVEVVDGGSGYAQAGPIVFSPDPNGASAVTVMSDSGVGSIDVISGGKGYDGGPDVSLTYSGDGHPAVAVAVIDPVTKKISQIELLDRGSGYDAVPTVTFSGGNMVVAGAATAVFKSRFIESVAIENPGSGFDPGPKVVFTNQSGSPSANAKAVAYVKDGAVTEIALLDAGEGYGSIPPKVTLEHPPLVSVADDAARILSATYVAKGKPLAVNDIILNVATNVEYTYLGHAPITYLAPVTNAAYRPSDPSDGTYCYQLDTPYSIYQYVAATTSWTTLNLLAQDAAWSTRARTNATAEIVWGPKTIQGATLTELGMGYTTAPTVVFDNTQAYADGAKAGLIPTPAFAIAHISTNQSVVSIEVKDGGNYYGTPPVAHFSGGRGTGVTAEVVMSDLIINSVEVVSEGSASSVPNISLAVAVPTGVLPDDFVNAELVANVTDGVLTSVDVLDSGHGYLAEPTVIVTGAGTGATVDLTMSEERVVGVKVVSPGAGYTTGSSSDVPEVSISGGEGSGAEAVATYGGLSGPSRNRENWFCPSPAFIARVGTTSSKLVSVKGIAGPEMTVNRVKTGSYRALGPKVGEGPAKSAFGEVYTRSYYGMGETVYDYKEYPTFRWGVLSLTTGDIAQPILTHAGYYQPSTGIFMPDSKYVKGWPTGYPEEAMNEAMKLPEYASSDLLMVANAQLDVWDVTLKTGGSGYTNPKVVFTGGPPLVIKDYWGHDYGLQGSSVYVGKSLQRKAAFKGRGYYAQFGVTPRLLVTPTATLTFSKANNPTHTYDALVDMVGGKIVSVTPTEPINLPKGYALAVALSGITLTTTGTAAAYSTVAAPLYVKSASVAQGGTGYNLAALSGTLPVTFSAGLLPGTGAAATAYFETGVCKKVVLTSAGAGYIAPPTAWISGADSVGLAVRMSSQKVVRVRVTNGGSGYAPYRGIIQSSSGSGGEVDLVSSAGKAASCRVVSSGLRYESGAAVVFPLPEENHLPAGLSGYLDSSGVIKIAVVCGGSGYYEGTTAVMGTNVGLSEPVTLELEAGTIKSARFTNPVSNASLVNSGGTITRAPVVQAKATIQTSPEYIEDVRVVSGGAGYNDSPVVVVESSTGIGADISAAASFDGKLEHVWLNSSGDGYGQTVTATAGKIVDWTFAPNATAFIRPTVGGGYLDSFIITNGGEYNPATVTARVVGGGGTGAQATPVITNGRITAINLTTKGQDYTGQSWVDIRSDFGRGAFAESKNGGGSVSSVKILKAGTGFPTTPNLTVNAAATKNAVVRPVLAGRGVGSVAITPYGEMTGGLGYSSAPAVTFSAPTDVPAGLSPADFTAKGRAFVMRGSVVSIVIDDPGDHYSSAPTITIADPPVGLSGLVSLDSPGLNTLFGIGSAPDVSVVNLNAEIAIVTGPSDSQVKMTTDTFTLRVNNDLHR